MLSPHLLRAFINERLTVAAEEIFQVFEKTVLKYEEEVSGCQREIRRLRGLLLRSSSRRAASSQPDVGEDESNPEQKQPDPSGTLGPGGPNPPCIKEESRSGEEDVHAGTEACPVHTDPRGRPQEELQQVHAVHLTLASASSSPPQSQKAEEGLVERGRETSAGGLSSVNHTQDGETSVLSSAEPTDLSPTSAGHRCCCCVCGRSFPSRQDLRLHVCPPRPGDACQICGETFSSPAVLREHMASHKGSSFCQLCGRVCNSITALAEHMAGHSGIKLHRCPVCGKECSRKGDLKIHMRIHTGEKPFCCSHCQKCFTHSGHLRKHMRSHTGERPYKCHVCGRGFLQSAHLKCHLMTHAQKC